MRCPSVAPNCERPGALGSNHINGRSRRYGMTVRLGETVAPPIATFDWI